MQSAAASIISCTFFFLQKHALIMKQVISYHVNLIIKCRKQLITRELHTAAASIISCRDEIGTSAVELGPLWEKHNRNTGSVDVIQA